MYAIYPGGKFLNHLCDEEPTIAANSVVVIFLNHLCDEELQQVQLGLTTLFLNHLCDEEPNTFIINSCI